MRDPTDYPEDIDPQIFEEARGRITSATTRLPRRMLETLAQEVVARLASQHERIAQSEAELVSPERITALCEALISNDDTAAAKLIADARSEGASVETVYLGHLGAAAKQLGEWWTEDRTTFVHVTIAAGRIYAIMRSLRAVPESLTPRPGRHAVFATVPGDMHDIGVTMAADLFRRRGWRVDLMIGANHDELVDNIDRARAVVIGLSASGPRAFKALPKLIVALRICHPKAFIMVSGHMAEIDHELIAVAGVDAITADIDDAIAQAERYAGEAARPET